LGMPQQLNPEGHLGERGARVGAVSDLCGWSAILRGEVKLERSPGRKGHTSKEISERKGGGVAKGSFSSGG